MLEKSGSGKGSSKKEKELAEAAPILGLTVLDEPGALQSNASILQMQLKVNYMPRS